MKKKKLKFILIPIISVILIVMLSVGGYYYYILFVYDDFGAEYEQNWRSEDGVVTLVTNNKKGFIGNNNLYDGTLKLKTGEAMDVCYGYSSLFDAYTPDGETTIFTGEVDYNPITSTLNVYDIEVYSEYADKLDLTEFEMRRCDSE